MRPGGVLLVVSIATILAAVGPFAWMGTFVAPEFEELFRRLPGGVDDLPVPTWLTLAVSAWCSRWWWVCALSAAAAL